MSMRDQHAGEPAHVALHEPEAGIDVLGEDAQETVDDAGAAHALIDPRVSAQARVAGGVDAADGAGR